MSAATCRAGTRLGRACRRRNPQWAVVGDPYGDRFCWQHVQAYAAHPGASGIAVHLATGRWVDVDSAGDRIPRTVPSLVEAFELARSYDGFERARRVAFASLREIALPSRGLHPDVSAALRAAQVRLSRVTTTRGLSA